MRSSTWSPPAFRAPRCGDWLALATACAALLLLPQQSGAQSPAVDTAWVAAPAAFPPGTSIQAFVGVPSADSFNAVRVRVPASAFIAPMSFQRDVEVVLISGVFALGRGNEPNGRRTKSLDPAHRATSITAGTAIHGWAGETALLQIGGEGPFVAIPVAGCSTP